MITEHKLLHRRNPWTMLRFNRLGTTMLYNNNTKEYEFYKHPSKVKTKAKAVNAEKEVFKLTPQTIGMILLSGALGISVALNVINMIV